MKFTKKELETIKLSLKMGLKECQMNLQKSTCTRTGAYWLGEIKRILTVEQKIIRNENRNLQTSKDN